MRRPIVFLDIETTGIDPRGARIFDVAMIRRELDGTESEYRATLRFDAAKASPEALQITKYHERTWPHPTASRQVATDVATWTTGAVIVGNNPAFDTAFLDRLLRRHHLMPAWHYQLLDIEAFTAGALRLGPPPWDSEALSRAAGVDPATFERHTALGDVRWCRAVYDAVQRRTVTRGHREIA